MRVNKYRGRRSYDKKWIYGSLLIDNNGDFHILESNIIEKDGHHIYIDSDYPMFFDNDTIGQFTGLHDKNGVEIYEGDICMVSLSYFKIKNEKATVIFRNGSFQFQYGCEQFFSKPHDSWDEVEVIGNIHERSEDNEYYM